MLIGKKRSNPYKEETKHEIELPREVKAPVEEVVEMDTPKKRRGRPPKERKDEPAAAKPVK